MKAKRLVIHPQNPEMRKIKEVVDCLKKGGIIIYPTDTIYGLGCDIFNTKAIERICQLKQVKPSTLSFICNDLSHISDYVMQLSTPIFKIMKKALPGPYTFILKANANVPKLLHTSKKTIGIRVPDHLIPSTIVKELGNPIITTSIKENADEVNPYISDPDLIYEKYEKLVDIVIDGGNTGTIPSTILDCTNDTCEIVREGAGSVDWL
jgi:tRNA threonylcarbamoyl adenosine modification protein (Sua5/YciO/YrdC/YwlC family)